MQCNSLDARLIIMELLFLFIICGALFSLSLALFPAWNALALKHVLKLIEAIGTLFAWGFWLLIAYAVLAWLGFVAGPVGCRGTKSRGDAHLAVVV
jgi:hypothetical protein